MLISSLTNELVEESFSKQRQPFWLFRIVCGHLFAEYFSANAINVFTHFLLNVFTFAALQRNSSTTKASGLSRRRVIKPNWITSKRNTYQCVPAPQLISTAWSRIGQKINCISPCLYLTDPRMMRVSYIYYSVSLLRQYG